MLCYVMSCYVMYVMLCYVMLCYVMLMLCYAMLCYVILCYGGVSKPRPDVFNGGRSWWPQTSTYRSAYPKTCQSVRRVNASIGPQALPRPISHPRAALGKPPTGALPAGAIYGVLNHSYPRAYPNDHVWAKRFRGTPLCYVMLCYVMLCMYVMYVCMYVCMHVCMYVCVCVYVM